MKHSTLSSSPNSGNTFVSGIPQRIYKFRALKDDMSNCNWVYGQLVYDAAGTPRITEVDKSGQGLTFHTCIKGTEGQFIGLSDMNGKEIYEGDIVCNEKYNTWEWRGVIKFSHGVFGAEWLSNVKSQSMVGSWGQKHNLRKLDDEIVERQIVIGNVHENPELLG